MHRLKRTALTAAVTTVAFILPAGRALAGGMAHSSCQGDGCEADATSTRGGATAGGPHRRGGTPSPISCRYQPLDVPAGAMMFRPDGSAITADGSGRWMERVCVDARDAANITARFPDHADPITSTMAMQEILRAVNRQAVYIAPKAVPDLVEEARSKLVFPTLQPRFAPSAPWTYVYVPTTLWLDGEPLTPQSATADTPGVRVTVTAEPQEVRWDTGDGDTVSCPTPGHRPDPATPSGCSHVWSWPSTDGTAAGAYDVTATVFWHVTWTAEGAPGGGDLGLVPQQSPVLRIPVAEIQVVNTPPSP